MKAEFQGQKMELDPGMGTIFSLWKGQAEVRAQFEHRTASEHTKDFAQFVERWTNQRKSELLKASDRPVSSELELSQMLLVSRDQGQTFDTLLTQEDLNRMQDIEGESLQFLVLSPIASGTKNLQEVLNEQVAFHFTNVLQSTGIHVKDWEIQDGTYIFQVENPSKKVTEVHVGKQPKGGVLFFEFFNHKQEKVMEVSVLAFEEWLHGIRFKDETIEKAFEVLGIEPERQNNQDAIKKALLLDMSARLLAAKGEIRIPQPQKMEDLEQETELVRAQRNELLRLSNVMAAKKQVVERKEEAKIRTQKKLNEEQEQTQKMTKEMEKRNEKLQMKAQKKALAKAKARAKAGRWAAVTGAGLGLVGTTGLITWEAIKNAVILS